MSKFRMPGTRVPADLPPAEPRVPDRTLDRRVLKVARQRRRDQDRMPGVLARERRAR
ncbi:hypothetical protein [Methylibium sp.]|uniref:hypothetical protein n=1 Tax=Methylibium sp. TaxID=2067992 RepID=UPI001830BDB8|nr:hypothetical protein [Methylibium sp.]MBA3590483.1 hypothetical protein [Methylibium sp.]